MKVNVKNWYSEGRTILILTALVVISVLGTVVGSLFNADSLNNLSQDVGNIEEVNDRIDLGQRINSCRASVQAGYDAALANVLVEVLTTPDDDSPVSANIVNRFVSSRDELEMLEQQRICTSQNPSRSLEK